MPRLTDIAAAKVQAAIEALLVPQEVRDAIEWEVIPAVSSQGLAYVPIVCVRVPLSADDYELGMAPPGFDPHAPQAEISNIIASAVREVRAAADDRAAGITASQNGHKRSPGGLALP